MEDNQNTKTQTEEDIKKEKLLEFLTIKDADNSTVYTTTLSELETIVSDILSMGNYTKTFSILNGKLELTYATILEKDRQSGYEYVRVFTDKNKDASRIQIETYTSKINIALHTVRITSNDIPTNLSTGKLEERMVLLADLPEHVILSLDKYLRVFLTLVNRAFNSEDVIKN